MHRPYKEPWPIEKTLADLHAGIEVHFDPMVVHALLDIRPQWAKVEEEQMQIPNVRPEVAACHRCKQL